MIFYSYKVPHQPQGYQQGPPKMGPPQQSPTKAPPGGPVPEQQRLSHEQVRHCPLNFNTGYETLYCLEFTPFYSPRILAFNTH